MLVTLPWCLVSWGGVSASVGGWLLVCSGRSRVVCLFYWIARFGCSCGVWVGVGFVGVAFFCFLDFGYLIVCGFGGWGVGLLFGWDLEFLVGLV